MKQASPAFFTVDVEKDLHTGRFLGITKGLPRLAEILHEKNVKATFFVTGEVLEKHPKIIKPLAKQGHEIAIHGYSHRRFDSLSYAEKESEIEKSVKAYKKIFRRNPAGFRAPQHSIDKETLRLLEKYHFRYDSSVCSKNIMLLRHLLKKQSNKKEIIKNFLGRSKPYKISKNLVEIPRSSPLLALGGFELKIYPQFLTRKIIFLHKLFRIPINFVMHSWDMIDIQKSRTSRKCPAIKFEKILESFIETIKKDYRILKLEEKCLAL